MLINRSLLSARACAALAVAVPALMVVMPTAAHAEFSVGLDIRIGYAPPPMPVYEQPPLPAPDYIWVPGHWAWSDWTDDYYWVQGYWQEPPEPGLLWTPAWWGWDDGAFRFHGGYWGREVGWYGGIDYGYGYHGHGWDGGRWDNGHISYNRAVINVTNVNVTNVYYAPVPVHTGPRASYNGGAGGVTERPSPQELRATQAPHIPPTAAQQQRVQQAASNPHAAASQMNAGWHPPAVHRVSASGTPIPRSEALAHGGATAGAPPEYQHPKATTGGTATSPHPALQGQPATSAHPALQGQAATGARPTTQSETAPTHGQALHPTAQGQTAPTYGQVPHPTPQGQATPAHGQAPHPAQPAPSYAHTPAPPPAPSTPPPAPKPTPKPVPPKPAPKPQRDEHHEHP